VAEMMRASARVGADVPLVATAVGDSDISVVRGRCNVISETGLGGTFSADLTGDAVLLELHLPNCIDTIFVRARVRYRECPRYGFEFLSLTQAQRQHINRYCELTGRPERSLMLDTLRKLFRPANQSTSSAKSNADWHGAGIEEGMLGPPERRVNTVLRHKKWPASRE
jgi:hypothetical protein